MISEEKYQKIQTLVYDRVVSYAKTPEQAVAAHRHLVRLEQIFFTDEPRINTQLDVQPLVDLVGKAIKNE